MRKLGIIPVAVKAKKFDVSFSYATPKELDIFALILLKAVESKDLQLKGATLQSVLLDLGFSKDLHGMFEKRLRQLISINLINYARCMPIPIGNALKDKSVNRQMIEVVKSIIADISAKTILMSALRLTSNGEDAIREMQFLSEEKNGRVTLICHGITGKVILESECKLCVEEETLQLNPVEEFESGSNEQLQSEIEKNKTNARWLKNGNVNTKIFDISKGKSEDVYINATVDIIENEGVVSLGGEEELELAGLVERECADKNIKLANLIYVDNVNHCIDIAKGKLFGLSNIQYSGIITNDNLFQKFNSEAICFDSSYYKSIEDDCLMLGVLKSDKTGVVIKYSEMNVCGVIIPIINEFSTKDEEGKSVFEKVYRKLIFNIIDKKGKDTSAETIEYMKSITPEYYEKWLAVQVSFIVEELTK